MLEGLHFEVAEGAPGPPVEADNDGAAGEQIAQADRAAAGVEVEIAFTKRLGAGLFGGEGFILQRLPYTIGRGA